MAIIKPFNALRPLAEIAAQVASKPYDVLNSEEARVEANGNPVSFLHVTKSEIDLPADVDTHSTAVYEKAKENLQQLIANGILFKEEKTLLLYIPASNEWPQPDRFGLCFFHR